jgi:hypothetical protein
LSHNLLLRHFKPFLTAHFRPTQRCLPPPLVLRCSLAWLPLEERVSTVPYIWGISTRKRHPKICVMRLEGVYCRVLGLCLISTLL